MPRDFWPDLDRDVRRLLLGGSPAAAGDPGLSARDAGLRVFAAKLPGLTGLRALVHEACRSGAGRALLELAIATASLPAVVVEVGGAPGPLAPVPVPGGASAGVGLEAQLAALAMPAAAAGAAAALRATTHPEATHRLLDLLSPRVLICRRGLMRRVLAVLPERPDARGIGRVVLRLIEIWAFYPELRADVGRAFLRLGTAPALAALSGGSQDLDPRVVRLAARAARQLDRAEEG